MMNAPAPKHVIEHAIMRPACALLIALASASAEAIDLGVYGPTYPIAEPDFIVDLTDQVQSKVDSGEWAQIEREAQTRILNNVTTPPPVRGLDVAREARTRLFDPSIVLSESITDNHGRILFPAGLRVNPLEVVSLTEPLLFFDARDEDQLLIAVEVIDRYEGMVTPILVGGSWSELAQAWERQVFFDQGGIMAARLGLQYVPALVTQDGQYLRIDELPVATAGGRGR